MFLVYSCFFLLFLIVSCSFLFFLCFLAYSCFFLCLLVFLVFRVSLFLFLHGSPWFFLVFLFPLVSSCVFFIRFFVCFCLCVFQLCICSATDC